MPGKRKKKAVITVQTQEIPLTAVVTDTFETALAFADFPCELAEAEARSLYATHGEGFVAWCAEKKKDGALPISLLTKIARVECAGGTVKERRGSFKDRK